MENPRWLGVHLLNHSDLTIAQTLELIALAERCGFDGITVNEDVAEDAFAVLAAAALRTERIALGTAITNVYTRSAMQIAMGAATVAELSGGRFSLGMSTGHHPWTDVYHGLSLDEKPLARLREYVQFIRGVLGADSEYLHEGQIFRGVRSRVSGQFAHLDIPIRVAGERGGILKLAGEIADGAILNVVSADYVRSFAADRVFGAARDVGRESSDLDLTVIVTCCLAEDRGRALDLARESFFARIEQNFQKRSELMGQSEREEIGHLVALANSGERARAVREISEALVTSTYAVGTAKQILSDVERFYDAGATRVLLVSDPRDVVSVAKVMTSVGSLRGTSAA
jgi:alkanesulfonate monooxygenase SsuD/methylene tetrahydromethanopterin reductase-like flavin-dependent oxidoreductase (luciferase family)